MNFGIIAAGEGSRLAGEGVSLPKPLVNINGIPMIRRLIDIFSHCGAGKICVVVNERMVEVRKYVEDLAQVYPVPIELTVKTTPSSMHSFHEIGKMLRGHGRFVATTVDTIFRENDFRKYVEAFAGAPSTVDGMMAMTSYIDDEKPLYIAARREEDGMPRITAFLDRKEAGVRYVSGGIYGLSDKALDVLDHCLEEGVARMRNYQRALVESGLDIRGYDMGKIIDVDHAGDIPKAEEFLAE